MPCNLDRQLLMTSHRPEPAAKALDSSKHAMFYYACFLALVAVHSVDGRNKLRAVEPFSSRTDCDLHDIPTSSNWLRSVYLAFLTSVADCKIFGCIYSDTVAADVANLQSMTTLSSVVDISRASCNDTSMV